MLNFDTQAVMGKADVGRQEFFRFLVSEVMSDMGEVSALGGGGRGNIEGFVQRKVARVGFVAQGIDPAAFDKAWTSFQVTSAVKQAGVRMREYGVNGVPNLIVNGKYRVSSGDAVTTQADMLKVVDFLVAKERSSKN